MTVKAGTKLRKLSELLDEQGLALVLLLTSRLLGLYQLVSHNNINTILLALRIRIYVKAEGGINGGITELVIFIICAQVR